MHDAGNELLVGGTGRDRGLDMTQRFTWSREVYEGSVSSRCWYCTPYEQGWDDSPELRADDELRELVKMEQGLAPIPAWATEIVERAINYPPLWCPHYSYPQPYLEIVDAIGSQIPPKFVHGCYTVDPRRKARMQDYVFCLDAWLAGVGPDDAANELVHLGCRGVDWRAVCRDIWEVLGERSELKELLVERLLHRERWWIKVMVWDDDARDRFYQDRYLGDTTAAGDTYGNPQFADPYFAELETPRVRRIEGRLAELCPDWQSTWGAINDTQLCAPKAFRFLERLIWSIGKGRKLSLPGSPVARDDIVPGFLQCQDTYPDQGEAASWFSAFLTALSGWAQDRETAGTVASDVRRRLGERTPVKVWLVRLLVRKLDLLSRIADGRALLTPKAESKRGTMPIAYSRIET
jgi:hypothetical protein